MNLIKIHNIILASLSYLKNINFLRKEKFSKKNYILYDNGKNPDKCSNSASIRKQYGYFKYVYIKKTIK